MPYARRVRRTRRGGRRVNRKLSNYRIATRIGARAQAGQIYALKKRINRIQRLTRPQTKILQFSTPINGTIAANGANYFTYTYNASGTTTTTYIQPILQTDNNTGSAVAVQSANHTNFARLHSLRISGVFEYDNVSLTAIPWHLRIVVLQLKTSRDALTVADIFTSTTSGANGWAAVYGPLQNGLSRTVRVLSDKRYKLYADKPTCSIKTNLRYLSSFYQDLDSSTSTADDANPSESRYKGSILIAYTSYADLGDNESQPVRYQVVAKLAYSSS